jgi:hypothetical protein
VPSRSSSQQGSALEAPPEGALVEVVDERAGAVDLDDGQPLAVRRLELRVAGDVDLLELEAELVAQPDELRARALAEVAPLGVVERDALDPGTLPGGRSQFRDKRARFSSRCQTPERVSASSAPRMWLRYG